MRMMISVLTAVATGYAVLAGLLYFYQDRLVYFPERVLAATPAQSGLAFESVRFTSVDGVGLSGWFIPAPKARATLLFCHGNAGNISHRLESIRQFHQLGLNVFIFDYRGYGESAGSPTEAGTYHDAEAARRYLVETRGLAPERIIYFGRSLGAAIAAWLATQHPPRALIVESGFTSIPDLGAEIYPWMPVRWLARLQYPTREYLEAVNVPVLVVHSRDDEIVPFRHGESVYAAARAPKEFLEIRGGHNDGFLVSGAQYTRHLDAFLRRVGLAVE